MDRVIVAAEYMSEEARRYYFGKADQYIAERIVDTRSYFRARPPKSARLEVIDLPSFPDVKTRSLALNSVLATEWERARKSWEDAIENPIAKDTRVPTFIVVDEAHNLVPMEPRDIAAETLREQFRTIAAEGRKYGMFLILCTQRPDKIDPMVLSECENRAIMKLGSRVVLEKTRELLGLEDVSGAMLSKCLEFEVGRALLVGQWAKSGPELLYSAMRRTVEGGRGLRAEHWATASAEYAKRPPR